jgi:4-hydroxybenzoate polyprenyltransferase
MKPGAVLASLRPHQWTKNVVVLAALALSKHLLETGPALRALLAFAVFCGLSGTVYLFNDVADYERDRLHPTKRLRPVASGALSRRTAGTIAVVLGIGCLLLALPLGRGFVACAAAYLVLNLAYSFRLKEIVILDVISVSLGFLLRVVAGGLAVRVPVSEWLLVCTILLALFLALSKRRAELVTLNDQASSHRAILAEYSPYLLDQMISVVTASCVTAYCFAVLAPETRDKFQTERLAWTIPFVIYGIFRYLYLVHQKEQGGSPAEVLATDRPLLLDVALWALAVVLIVYAAPGAPTPFRD